DRGEAGLGRTVRGLRVKSDDLADYVEQLVRTFLDQRGDQETFAVWAHRATDADLSWAGSR
ncbi:MAG: hypothetical protein L0G99_17030, partial [Propionibacteriales bacterium]|nr:hypothetical protein [Propionibacteriales bacterium]